MPTDLQFDKLDRAFNHIDANRNGQIERDDLLALGARLLVGFGQAPTSVKGRQLLDRYDDLWDELATRLDTDGALSPAEFRDGMIRAFIDGDRYQAILHPAAQAVAALADTDDDGRVSATEFEVLQRAFGVAAPDSQAAFIRLDSAGAGHLGVLDLVEASRQYYTSPDPDAPGNWLYGPL